MVEEITLEAGRSERNYWRDLWRYRELFYFLAWRDILVRYKQTAIGVAWAIVRPLLTMLVFTIVFGKIAKFPSPPGVPYSVLVLAGVLPWQFFSTALAESSISLVGNANLLSKIYFPRLIVPASAVITSFVDFLVTLVLMALMMAWYHITPDVRILSLSVFIGLTFGLAFGAGLWCSALNVQFRDFRYIIPFVVQFGFFLCPVGFSSGSVVPNRWRWLYSLNPMVGPIEGFRWALLRGETPLDAGAIITSFLATGALCVSGVWYFRKMEKNFADVI